MPEVTAPPIDELLTQLDDVLDQLHAACAEGSDLADESLLLAVEAMVGPLSAKHVAAVGKVVGEWDRRKLWKPSGARSPIAWLIKDCRVSRGAARQEMRRARLLRDLAHVAAGLSAGKMTVSHLDAFERASNSRTRASLIDAEAALVDLACRESWFEFDRQFKYWSMGADPDGPELREERRRVFLSQTEHDNWALNGWFDPISGEIIDNELNRIERGLFQEDWDRAKAELGREPLVEELTRTPAQRRADAMVVMARRSAGAPGGMSLSQPLFTLAIGPDVLPRICELLGGTVVHPDEMARWVAEADIERMIFSEDGRTIEHNKRRRFGSTLARAIGIRDRICSEPYCFLPARRCEIDHERPHSAGGRTSLENGRLLCGPHNRARNKSKTNDQLPVDVPADEGLSADDEIDRLIVELGVGDFALTLDHLEATGDDDSAIDDLDRAPPPSDRQ